MCTSFSYKLQKRERTLKLKRSTGLVSPPSPPSLLHSPYLPPWFLRQPSCSALMKGHPQLLEWRKGDTEKKRKHISQQLSSQACKLILFLLLFTFFQCDFSGSGWVVIYIYSDMLENLCVKGLCCTVESCFFFFFF